MSAATELIALAMSQQECFVGVKEEIYQPAVPHVKPASAIEIMIDMRGIEPDYLRVLDEMCVQFHLALAHRYEHLCITYRDHKIQHGQL